ncbi:hypothetical protein [Vibrio genomosp. F10]|uniref:hypothetical protein n=1 Tax=Vibrio genomosp. F10 TaxID=723171 RepID=UPI000379E752|nr:hypothetical protein [Vibrio genomosp. F10]OEE92152.1 hypothetical protein A1QK_17820 [Vibrio genomosp. F10 str. 9ZD137]
MIKLRHLIILTSILMSPLGYCDYPNIERAVIDSKGTQLNETDNVVKLAIEKKRFISLRYDEEFKRNRFDLFKEVEQLSEFELNAYVNASLVRGIQDLVGEFACATYRHYSEKPQANTCDESVTSRQDKEGKPFLNGQYVKNRIATTINNISHPPRSYDLFLPSAEEKPLSTLWGAVHEIELLSVDGTSTRSIVLTVYIDAYKVNREGDREESVIEGAQVVLVVVPEPYQIGRESSEQSARSYAINNAKVLVPFYAE